MNIKKEINGSNTVVEIELDNSDLIDSLSLGMITNNSINGIAHATCTQLDTVRHLKYVINSKITMSQLIQNVVNKKLLLSVFSNILRVLISSEDYMLNSKTILLDNEFIFIDPSNGAVSMICVPLMQEQNEKTLYEYFKTLIFSVQVDFSENSEYIVRLINYFNSKTSLDRIDFASFIVNLMNLDSTGNMNSYNNVHSAQPVQSIQPAQPVKFTQPVQSIQPAQPIQPIQSAQPVQPAQPIVPNTLPNSVYESSVSTLNSQQNSPPVSNANNAKFSIPGASKSNQMNIPNMQVNNKNATEDAKKQKKKSFNLFGTKKTESADTKEKKSAQSTSGFKFAVPGQIITANNKDSKNINSAENSIQVKIPDTIQSNHNYFPHTQQVDGNFGQTTVLGLKTNETTVLGMSGETTVLNPMEQMTPPVCCPYLVRMKNNEKIPVNKPVFRIGKEKSYVDYFIGDNSTISRSHANIITRNGKYYVVDTNSTNHTFLDGGILQSNSEYEIVHGSKLRFANEDFEFKLY